MIAKRRTPFSQKIMLGLTSESVMTKRDDIAKRRRHTSAREQSLARRPGERAIERTRQAREQLVDLVGLDDQRRARRDRVADHGAHDQPFLLGKAHAARRNPELRVEGALARLVGDEL